MVEAAANLGRVMKSRDIFRCPGCGKTFGRLSAAEERYKWVEMKIVPEDFDPGEGWLLATHADGTQQVYSLDHKWPPVMFIERVVREKSRRKRWCVVCREPIERWSRAMYGPKIAGPFPNLESAQAAYLIIVSATK
jgi:hypothetical protein